MPSFSFDFTLDYYSVSALVNVVTSIALGTFVYFHNKKAPINKGFAFFAWFVAAWSVGYFFWQISTDATTALFWSRTLMLGAIFTPIAFLQFVFGLLDISRQKGSFIRLSYALFFLFVILDFTPYFVARVEPALFFQFWPKPGILFHPFLAIWISYLVYAGYTLLIHYKNAVSKLQAQIKYVLAAMVIAFMSGSTNYFLWYNIPIPPIANILVSAYVAIITYAIVKERLFDIRVVLTQLFAGIIAVLLFINFVLSESPFEYFWKGGLLVAFLGAGYLLVRSVMNEIKQREELQRAYAKLKELDEAKSEFVSIASHQLRTPLTAIKGYISMILEGSYGALQGTQEKPMKSVYESNERLIRLVNDLLNISRIESGRVDMKWAQKNIGDIVKSVIEEISIKAQEKKLKIVFEKPEESLPEITLDEEKIRNVLLNVVDNAIRYTKKGKITIRAYAKQDASHKRRSITVEIKDTGDGMTQEELNHLFESFSRGGAGTRMSTEGAGLGLYIAKQFVNLHKGKIWAESQGRGKGSTFFIELPIT